MQFKGFCGFIGYSFEFYSIIDSYTRVYLPVRRDNLQALVNQISPIQTGKPWYEIFDTSLVSVHIMCQTLFFHGKDGIILQHRKRYIVPCLNFGSDCICTHLSQMENLWILGVPIFKYILISGLSVNILLV